jgi:O-methyltransferase
MKESEKLYLDLMKKCLTYTLWGETVEPYDLRSAFPSGTGFIAGQISHFLQKRKLRIMRAFEFDPVKRALGQDWPPLADTMIGLKRLDNLQFCIEDVIKNNVPGDFIETGVWRGGGSIFMRAALRAYGVTGRTVWVADSFEGLPAPNADKYPHDAGDPHHTIKFLAVSLEQVKANFAKYGLLDGQVQFLKGWFKDTLPKAPIQQLALIRLDGDMYESTMDGLTNLYPKLAVGGYMIVDDYVLKNCRQAVYDYRSNNGITEEIIDIDGTGAYWQRVR